MALITTVVYEPQVAKVIYQDLILGAPTLGKDTVTVIPGVGFGSLKLPALKSDLGSPIAVCTPLTSGDVTVTEKLITMNQRMMYMEDCYNQYQTLFNAQGPFAHTGTNGYYKLPGGFQTALLENIINNNKVNVEKFIWRALTGSGNANYAVPSAAHNGFVGQLKAQADSVLVVASGLINATAGATSILTKLNSMLSAAPATLVERIFSVGDVYFWVPVEFQVFFMQAFSNNLGTLSQTVQGLNMLADGSFTYMGIKIIFTPGLNPGTFSAGSWGGTGAEMVLSYKENMFVAVDVSDIGSLKLIDVSETSKVDGFIFKGQYNIGMNYLFGTEIVRYMDV